MPPWDLTQTLRFDGPGQWGSVDAAEDGADGSAEPGSPLCSSHSQVWKMFLDHLISNGKLGFLNCKYRSDLRIIFFVIA